MSSSSAINKKEYLKRYLSKDLSSEKKKKKKKTPKTTHARVKIIDDNIDVQEQMQSIQDIQNQDEDAPQVVAVYDERPIERMEQFKEAQWKTVNSVPIVIKDEPDCDSPNSSPSPCSRNRTESPGRQKYSDDYSPPRRKRRYSDSSPPRNRKGDRSPPTRNDRSPRRNQKESASPPRRRNDDRSPPRRNRKESASPPRRRNDDRSPLRRRNDDRNPPRRRNDDRSPPRRRSDDRSPPRRRNDDRSPPRRSRKEDQSPPRKIKKEPEDSTSKASVSQSPPRRNPSGSPRKHSRKSRWASRSPPPQPSERATKTLDGKTAGLQNAKDLAKETQEFREREAKLFAEMAPEVSGVNSQPIMRDRKTGKIRNLEEEAAAKQVEKRKTDEVKKKYDQWGKGVKQVDEYKQKLEQDAYEMTKPLARYADDEDLERYLKEQERAGDPMLAYLRKKKKDDAVAKGVPLKPEYQGEFMPNRYGIRPGHKWDGVDRSNGYEKKWFDAINDRNSQREEAYKWNSEDM